MESAMLVIEGTASDTENLRSQLHHSWLKNEVLILRPDYLAKMREKESPQRASFEEKIKPGGKFWQRIDAARRLCETITEGFSPAQLVDAGELAALPDDVRALMKQVLHDAYRQETGIEELRSLLLCAINEVSNELDGLSRTWFQEPPAPTAVLAAAVNKSIDTARKLRDLLIRLPTGIVLP